MKMVPGLFLMSDVILCREEFGICRFSCYICKYYQYFTFRKTKIRFVTLSINFNSYL